MAIVPGEAFGAPGYARLSYALGDDDLVEGVTRIAKLLAESLAAAARPRRRAGGLAAVACRAPAAFGGPGWS